MFICVNVINMFKIVFINSLEFPFGCRCIFAGWQECIYHWNYHKLIYMILDLFYCVVLLKMLCCFTC